MKFAVFGAGGVGGYLGARLADAGHEVHLIARGDHLAALRSSGLRVESIAGDTSVAPPATDDPADIGPCDYVLFCVKSYDTRDAASDLAPLLGEETAVVSFQNGVDNEAWLADEIGAGHVVGGVAYIFSTIAESGVVAHTGGPAPHGRPRAIRLRRTRRGANPASRGVGRRALRVCGGRIGASQGRTRRTLAEVLSHLRAGGDDGDDPLAPRRNSGD